MKVLFVASECTPIVKVGGLGDVVGSLPKALKKLGVDVRIVIPAYKPVLDALHTRCVPQAQPHTGCEVSPEDFVVHYANQPQKVTLHQILLPQTDIPVYLIENQKYLSGGGVYLDPSAFAVSQDEIERFAFFSKAITEIFIVGEEFYPDIVHCHDWHTGMVPQLIKAEGRYLEQARPATVFTIHNLANQGISNEAVLNRLNMPSVFNSDFVKYDLIDHTLDFMLQGILGSDVVSTVSPAYADEIKTDEFGEGLQEVIKARDARVFGILNGIDNDLFNPELDPYLKVRYSLQSEVSEIQRAKKQNKALLQEELGLEKKDVPMVGLVSRLTNQKGIDIVVSSIDEMIKMGFQVVLLGTGDKTIEEMIKSKVAEETLRGNCAGILKFDEGIARRIYASSDIFLIPSRFEPCGLTQMVAMRYATVPLARFVGGLKNTVHNGFNGFTFNNFTQSDFLGAVKKAKYAYYDKKIWDKMMENCINSNFSWDKSAGEYITLYGKALSFSAQK